ncbi:hypothetical protein KAR91_39520 [Candidatus Pacearchaeota archaeon]|nr:hypothetical protein [Candidatus Pacearchaeota archaeon]
MKKILMIFWLLVLGACEFVPAQGPHIWKYSAANTPRTNFADDGYFTWYTAGADSLTSRAFGPGYRFTWNEWNGLLGTVLRVDSIGGVTDADTIYFYLIHDLGVDQVKEPDTLTWQNANDSTETTSYIALPADDGKIWIWQNNPTGHYLQKFPDNTYYMRAFTTGADSMKFKQQHFGY